MDQASESAYVSITIYRAIINYAFPFVRLLRLSG
jgi:hypothetical protein